MIHKTHTISRGYSSERAEIIRQRAVHGAPCLVNQLAKAKARNQTLLNIWLKGISARNYLAFEAKLQDFHVDVISGAKSAATAQRDEDARLLFSVVKENIYQHAGREGIYLSRSTTAGYEFIGLDYGPGVINMALTPVNDLSGIFDPNTGYGPGGDSGNGTFSLARMTHLTRVISLNGGKIRVVDKKPVRTARPPVPVIQTDFAIEGEEYLPTGFIVHGFVMQSFSLPALSSFLPPSPNCLLSPIITKVGKGEGATYYISG